MIINDRRNMKNSVQPLHIENKNIVLFWSCFIINNTIMSTDVLVGDVFDCGRTC